MPARVARAFALALLLAISEGQTCFAIESPETPRPGTSIPSPSPANAPAPFSGMILPQGSEITLVLTYEVNSSNVHDGSSVMMHVKDPIVVNGVTVADAGTPTILRVIKVNHAGTGNVDASMQIAIDPIPLRTGGALPVRLSHELIAINHTAGEASTQELVDAATMIVFAPLLLLHVIQKGQDVKLPAGTPIKAYTMAAVDARDRSAVVIATPRPLILNGDPVHSEYSPAPFVHVATPSPRPTRTPAPRPTATPAASPGAVPSEPPAAAGTGASAPPSPAGPSGK